jgi:iron complex outermembrane receptor protein
LTANLGWSLSDAGGGAVEPRLSLRRHADEFILRRDDPSFYRNVHTSWQYGGELHARHPLSAHVRFAAGGELFRDALESNALGERSATRAAGFGELSAGTPGAWLLQSGVRLDWHSEFGDFVAPSAALAWWPADRVRLRASVGRSFRAPGWTERYYEDPANIGSADLLPERAWTAELGGELAFAHGRVDVVAFRREAEQLIDWARVVDDPASPWRTMNIEDATFRGVEALVELRGPLDTHWSLTGAALSVAAEEANGFTSKYALRPLAHTVVLALDRPVLRGAGLGARLRTARRVSEDAYTVLDVRASYRLGSLRAYADLTNLTDEEYLDVSVQRAPGRQLRIGVRWTGS